MLRRADNRAYLPVTSASPATGALRINKLRCVVNTIVKALVRAHRWRGMLEEELLGSVRELAKAERINEAYLGRVLRLTLLSPIITEAILCGRLPDGADLGKFLRPFPVDWKEQKALFFDRS